MKHVIILSVQLKVYGDRMECVGMCAALSGHALTGQALAEVLRGENVTPITATFEDADIEHADTVAHMHGIYMYAYYYFRVVLHIAIKKGPSSHRRLDSEGIRGTGSC